MGTSRSGTAPARTDDLPPGCSPPPQAFPTSFPQGDPDPGPPDPLSGLRTPTRASIRSPESDRRSGPPPGPRIPRRGSADRPPTADSVVRRLRRRGPPVSTAQSAGPDGTVRWPRQLRPTGADSHVPREPKATSRRSRRCNRSPKSLRRRRPGPTPPQPEVEPSPDAYTGKRISTGASIAPIPIAHVGHCDGSSPTLGPGDGSGRGPWPLGDGVTARVRAGDPHAGDTLRRPHGRTTTASRAPERHHAGARSHHPTAAFCLLDWRVSSPGDCRSPTVGYGIGDGLRGPRYVTVFHTSPGYCIRIRLLQEAVSARSAPG